MGNTVLQEGEHIDDLLIEKGDTSNAANLGYEIITLNRLKLGRNNFQP